MNTSLSLSALAPGAAGVATPLEVAAFLLAAGRGERMRPLTDSVPKPLLPVRGKALLAWHLEALERGGCARALINTAWLGEQVEASLGAQYGALPITYSHEGRDFGAALETAGGICRALPQLSDVFWVLAGDVYAPDFVFAPEAVAAFARSASLAHIWLVPNPPHHPKGDFAWDAASGLALDVPDAPNAQPRYTYSTIGLYRKAFFTAPWCPIAPGNAQGVAAPLGPMLRAAMAHGAVSAALYSGAWTDVGTPERLAQLNAPPMQR